MKRTLINFFVVIHFIRYDLAKNVKICILFYLCKNVYLKKKEKKLNVKNVNFKFNVDAAIFIRLI